MNNFRELTTEELNEAKEALVNKMGYNNAVNWSQGWDLETDGEYVAVVGYHQEDEDEPRVIHWDEIYENLNEVEID